MDFSIMFFSSADQGDTSDRYYLLKHAAQFADQKGFCGIWTPERHFHNFGGLFPNPSVLSAALAMITERIQIRAGSVVSPLHNSIRIAEEWSVVDNLSSGRVAISFGSGWNIDDFVLAPASYAERQSVMYEQIREIRDLWSGNSVRRLNPAGKEISIELFPQPVQRELPIWITSSGNVATFRSAGSIGANVLTHLLGQELSDLAEKILAYRKAREEHNDGSSGTVSLMLHAYLGTDIQKVKTEVKGPFREYLRSAIGLEKKSAKGGGVISGGKEIQAEEISSSDMDALLDLSFERYFETAALMGTPSSCMDLVRKLESIGVDEIACLIDFGVPTELVLHGLEHLDKVRAMFTPGVASEAVHHSLQEFMAEI